MFEFSCQNSNIVNWILDQVSYRADALFSRNRGWEVYIRLLYPTSSESCFFVVIVSDGEECILFIPLDENSPTNILGQFIQDKFVESIKRDLEFSCRSHQLIFLTSEKLQESITNQLETFEHQTHLLILSSDTISFTKGKFNNPRLEYRFEQLEFDPELIPSLFMPDLGDAYKGLNRTVFYQDLFHTLNKFWIQGIPQANLRKVLRSSVPFWQLMGKNQRKALTSQVEIDLDAAFKKVGTELPQIHKYQKKPSSQPETSINLPEPPETRKDISDWMKNQRVTLRFLSDDTEQITIDILNLSLSS